MKLKTKPDFLNQNESYSIFKSIFERNFKSDNVVKRFLNRARQPDKEQATLNLKIEFR